MSPRGRSGSPSWATAAEATGRGVIAGYATAEGTARYRARHEPVAAGHFRSWNGLAVASVGMGTHLGPADAETDAAYREAISQGLGLALNVVDSAVNYRHQRSERSVGTALRALIGGGAVARDEVVVTTKAGFIPFDGGAPPDPAAYIDATYVRPGVLGAGDVVGGSHCIAPGFLADQLERSRRNLGLGTIDVYFLHNPETQLAEIGRAVFLRRMRAAFEFLEGASADGGIRVYGVATWTGLRQLPSAPDFLALSELVALAREVAGDEHHFRAIQLPYNLKMTEAFTHANQPMGAESVSVLDAARLLGLYVMTSASMYQGQLARNLPPVVSEFLPGLESDGQRALQFVRSTPGVGTALVGMKQAVHVEENGRLRMVPPLGPKAFGRLFSGA